MGVLDRINVIVLVHTLMQVMTTIDLIYARNAVSKAPADSRRDMKLVEDT